MFSLAKLIIPLVVIFLLCSCSTGTQISPCVDNISFNAETVWDDTDYSLLCKTHNEKLEMKILSPERIKDCEFIFSGDKINIKFLGLEKEADKSVISENSPLKVIHKGFEIAKQEKNLTLKDNKYYCKFKLSDTEYTFTFGASGLPIEITDKNKHHIIFKSVTILSKHE